MRYTSGMELNRTFAWLRPGKRQSGSPEGDTTAGRSSPAGGGRRAVYPGQSEDILLEEQNPNLKAYRRYQSFRAMSRGVFVCAAYENLIAGLAGKAQFAIDGDEDRIQMALYDGLRTNWADTKTNMAEALTRGFSLSEWATERVMGYYRLRAIRRIPQSSIQRFNIDEDGLVDYFIQYTRQMRQIRRWQCLYVTHGTGVNGIGVFMNVADLALQYLNHQRLVMAARGANLRDIPDFAVPADDIRDKKPIWKELNSAISDKKAGIRVVLPSDVYKGDDASSGVKFAAASRQYDIMRHEPVPISDSDRLMQMAKEIAVGLNCEALLLGQDGAGSLALARVQAKMLMDTALSILERSAEEVERMLATVWMFNGWPEPPTVTVDHTEWLEPDDIADALTKVSGITEPMYLPAIKDLMKRMGLPLDETADSTPPQPDAEGDEDGS